jgi:hypothetical protein
LLALRRAADCKSAIWQVATCATKNARRSYERGLRAVPANQLQINIYLLFA